MVVELTEEEVKFIQDRCHRKAMRLEESHLMDTPCYRLANSILMKLTERSVKKSESGK